MPATVRLQRASTRGPRLTMEDRDVAVQRDVRGRLVTLAAVFDGHGGPDVSDRAAAEFAPRFFTAVEAGGDVRDALERACADVAAMCATHQHVGSTACAAAVVDSRLTALWIGDSQIVVATPRGLEAVGTPHRLDDGDERARVLAAGAGIDGPYLTRGDRGLMVTRAFGDAWFRPVGVVAEPATLALDLEPGVAHLVVIGTDGLWDVIAPETTVQMIAAHEARCDFDYARALVDLALTSNTHDNVAVVTLELRA